MDQEFYTSRLLLWGHSLVIVVPRALANNLGLVHRDVVGLRKIGRNLLLKRLVAGEVMPVSAAEVEAAARDGGR